MFITFFSWSKRLKELIDWGANFDKVANGEFDLGKEGGHSENRVVHHKDQTGLEIERAILRQVNQIDNITTADINNDGITDIFISNGGSDAPNGSRGDTNKVYISSNNKLILSQFPKDYNSFFHYVNLGDINNDSFLLIGSSVSLSLFSIS